MQEKNGKNGHSHVAESTEVAPEEIGVVVRGSLSDGLEMRLAEGKSVEDLRVGKFVVVQGERYRFFAMLSDVQLSAAHPGVLMNPPAREDRLSRAVLTGTSTFGTIKLRPMLMTSHDAAVEDENALLPVKTVPAHFSPVAEASREDVGRVFGDERRDPKFFHVGEPLDMDTPVCLNLDRWVERSNAIFGKSGTGKTFLTRLCLCGVIKAEKAVNLIFDMHSEYGWQGTTEQVGRNSVRGLKQYFRNRVQIFTLDPESAKRRGVHVDFPVYIPYSAVTVEDILLLQRELNLNATAVETCYLLVQRFGEKTWLETFLKMDGETIKEFVGENNAHSGAMMALQRKLNVLVEDCKAFLLPSVPGDDDAVQHILQTLQSGRNVVLEFGQHDRVSQYMLVVNILTRRLHTIYREMTEKAMGSDGQKPRPLVITIEEAHKFLASHLADQTIFGTIAREMRKYNVTLLIVDQRPSGIDDEVLSQVGTKICCLLDDEKDREAVLAGVSGANSLRTILAGLETRQQALIFGHAVPMPVVVRTRQYDDAAFQAAMREGSAEAPFDETAEDRRVRLTQDRELDFA
ncbi:MAG TPA: ATP-binding protein [Chthonomonadaceae bacterium]|nr:ATP-binding protein [Chthonomonadaceae bacterium]